jgi:mycothiol system anti-sigma-R factor
MPDSHPSPDVRPQTDPSATHDLVGHVAGDPVSGTGHAHGDHEHEGCDEALAELYTFLDNELTVEMRVRIERHLNDCSPCLEAFDFEAELRQVVRHRCRDQVPEGLRLRIAEQISHVFVEQRHDEG